LTAKAFRRRSAPSIISGAITGIAQACRSDPDAVLRDLLIGAIDDCAALVRRGSTAETREAEPFLGTRRTTMLAR